MLDRGSRRARWTGDMDDSDLVTAASSGDHLAISELMRRNLPQLRAYVRVRLGERLRAKESVSDVVQSACLEVLRDLDRYVYQGEQRFRQWLFEAAYRKIVDRARFYDAQKRDAGREVSAGAQSPTTTDGDVLDCYGSFCTPSRVVAAREEMARVERAMDQLPEDYRKVILMARIVGLSHAAIAEEMGRKEGTVRVLLYRALTRLSELLKGDGG